MLAHNRRAWEPSLILCAHGSPLERSSITWRDAGVRQPALRRRRAVLTGYLTDRQ
jgi:hypothetical protein